MIAKHWYLFGLIALIVPLYFVSLIERPGYTDAYYYFNAANRLVNGDGLTDMALFTYVGLPESLPAPSHLYWMPLTSLAAAAGMWLLDAPGDYTAARLPFALMITVVAWVGFGLGYRLGKTARHAWVAGLLTLFSGFFVRYWGVTDNFAPYALTGSLALAFMGLSATGRRGLLWALLAGVFAALGHLARADGLLLLIVAVVALLWPGDKRRRLVGVVVLGYLLAMSPWFLRNLDVIGTVLPVGGADAMWFTSYNELFNYPPGASPQTALDAGIGAFLAPRWTAFTNNMMTFIAVEGMVIIAPLMLIGLWNRRDDRFLRPFALYALGLHLAMTFVFPHAGYRGGLFHSAAALIPFWMALGVVGLDDAVCWVAARRRNWKAPRAQFIFSVGLVLLGVVFSWNMAQMGRVRDTTPTLFVQLDDALPADAVVMVNDPPQLYYYTGRGAVVMPNASVESIPLIAEQYGVTHLLFETAGGALILPERFNFDRDNLPPFVTRLDIPLNGAVLYALNP
jgi:hypothetical protein